MKMHTSFGRCYAISVLLNASALVATTAIVPASAVAQTTQAIASEQTSGASGSSTSTHGFAPKDLARYPEVQAYIESGKLGAALNALQAHESEHEDDPDYHNILGILALKLANYAAAVTAFERVVLMQPENAGAWLDLAIASAEAGNLASASAYFDYIENQFSPPTAVNVIIARYRARMAARQHLSPWQFSVDAMVGVDSNANSGLQNSAIPLTFGTDRVELLLDPSFHARSDRYVQAGMNAGYRQPLGDNLLDISMGIRTRDYVHENSFSTVSANLSAGLYRPTALGDVSTLLHLEHIWLGGSALLRNVRAVAQLEHPIDSCRVGFSVESEWRRYTELNSLDANILWGQAAVACDWKLVELPIQTILLGRTGFDHPTGDRAGGATRHNELIAQIGVPIAWGARAEFSTTFAKATDEAGYSPLLEDNAARWIDRRNMRLSVTVPLDSTSDMIVLAEDNRFRSNLSLFRQAGRSISVGFRYKF